MRMLKVFLIYTILMLILAMPSLAAQATIKGTDIRIRKEPNTTSEVLEYVSSGDKIDIIEKEGKWYKIKAKGVTGYVREDLIEISEQVIDNNQENGENQIQEGNINVHIIPSISSSIIGIIDSQTQYTLGDTINKWTYIYNDNISGWVVLPKVDEDSMLKEQVEEAQTEKKQEEEQEEQILEEETEQEQETEEQQEEQSTENKKGYINVDSANLREKPSTDSEIIGGLIKNEEITIIAEQDGWYKVEVDGVTGYIADWLVSDKKVEVTNRSLITEREQVLNTTEEEKTTQDATTNTATSEENTSIVEYAKQYLGCPYVYGGSGPKSFDCSGFTMYVYKKFGVSLPHTARGQSQYGTYVAKQDLKPGDIVFFKDYETMDGIGHCGIYIGNGDFIHASSGTGYCVKISTLLSGSYLTRYETARRVL